MTERFAPTFAMILVLIATAAARADGEWPQWRGPSGSGAAAADADPPTQWNPKHNVKWKVRIPGSGTSTPIVWGERVFIQTAVPTAAKEAATLADDAFADVATCLLQDRGRRGGRGPGGFGGGAPAPTTTYRFALLCIDRKTGKTLWDQSARTVIPHEGHHRDHGFSSHSPVTDGAHVWAYFGSRGLHCYDMTGKRIWDKDLGKQSTRNSFGEGSSPALHGDTIVVNWDHEGDDFIVAFDKLTGNEKWRQKRDEPTTWTTPIIVEHAGKAQVIVAGTNRVRAYDLASGKEIWHAPGLTQNVIPTPIAADGIVYLTSGFRGAALYAVKLGREGDLTGTDAILWTREKSTPYVPSPLLASGTLYMFAGNVGRLSAIEAKTGKVLLDGQRIDRLDNVYASPVAAKDRLYFVGRDGTTIVMRHAGGDKLQEVAVNELNEGVDASPAIAGKEIFLRGRENLYCIAE